MDSTQTETQTTAPDTTASEQTSPTEIITTVEPVAPTHEEPKVSWYKRRSLVVAIGIAIFIIGGAGYYLYANNYKNGGVVARVNGEAIYRTELDETIHTFEQSAAGQGINTDDAEFKATAQKQALENLIDNMLLTQAAHASGIEVTDADINEVHDQLVQSVGGEDALKKKMADIGLSEEKLKSNITDRVLVNKYLESVSDIKSLTVSDDEITEFIKKNIPPDTATSSLPSPEELRPMVQAQILSQKQQDIVTKVVDGLRKDAKIDERI